MPANVGPILVTAAPCCSVRIGKHGHEGTLITIRISPQSKGTAEDLEHVTGYPDRLEGAVWHIFVNGEGGEFGKERHG